MPPSKLTNRMKMWGKNKNTKPLKNTLINRTASKLTANQIMKILSYNPVLLKNTLYAIERRAGNMRSLNSFMKNYYRKKYM